MKRLTRVEKEVAMEVAKENRKKLVMGAKDPQKYIEELCGAGRSERE